VIILGLDQSSKCGWCVGDGSDAKPRFGVYHVPDHAGHEGYTIKSLRDWLINFIRSEGVDEVFWEWVYVPPTIEMNTLFKLVSYANAVQLACAEVGVPDSYVTAGEWREKWLGRGSAPKHLPKQDRRGWLKQAAIDAAAERGWLVDSDDAAEAIGIWHYGQLLRDKLYQVRSAPLFRRKQAEGGDGVAMTWQLIDTAPQDGSEFEILCYGGKKRRNKRGTVLVQNIRYARHGMDKHLSLCGRQNRLSTYLTATHWRKPA
jgi:hypothetical protein